MNDYRAFYEWVVAIVRPAIVTLVLVGLAGALRRTTLPPRRWAATWLAVALPLVAWLVLVWVAAAGGAFEVGRNRLPLVPLAVFVPVGAALPLLMRSKNIAAAVDAAPPSWLVGIQLYRVVGANFLIMWAYGAIPGAFALPAGIGDVLVGLLAIPVAVYLAAHASRGRAIAFAWNVLGIVDFLTALTLGVLTTPGPLQHLALDHPNLLTFTYPTVMTPTFAVPFGLILHGLSLWQLRRAERRNVSADLPNVAHVGAGTI